MPVTPDTYIISEAERLAWLRLSRSENVGPITFNRLLRQFGSAVRALDAIPDLARRGGRLQKLKIQSEADGRAEIQALTKLGARHLLSCDAAYPAILRHLEDAPPVLTVKGNPALLEKPMVSIVGARNASLPGRRMAEILAAELGQAGYTIVSGLARGIDTAAHGASLTDGTVAVVAGGIDIVYPAENQTLYDKICAQGIVIAENPPGVPPTNRDFPRRNRIISGLALGTVIVEAALKSGSLITARYALEQGREVFAIPGSPLDPRAGGTNKLIKDGATLVESAADIINVLRNMQEPTALAEPWQTYRNAPLQYDDNAVAVARRRTLTDLLSFTPVTLDEILRTGEVNPAALHTALLELELAGRAQRLSGNRVILATDDTEMKAM